TQQGQEGQDLRGLFGILQAGCDSVTNQRHRKLSGRPEHAPSGSFVDATVGATQQGINLAGTRARARLARRNSIQTIRDKPECVLAAALTAPAAPKRLPTRAEIRLKTASSSSKASLSVHPAYTFGFAHDHAPFVSSTSSLPSRSLCSDVHGSLAETSIRPHPCQRHRLAPQSSQTDSRSTAHLCRRARTRTLFRSSDLTLNFDGSLANRACNSNTTDHTCSELPDFTIGRLKTKTSFASGLHVLGLA
ncbi:hypothetical protein E5Q_00728, partial [Mixia osmundae IAM 14324]